MNRDPFSQYHPAVNFSFFAAVLIGTVCLIHPLTLAVSLVSALSYAWVTEGKQEVLKRLGMLLPILALTALINVLFNHEGMTVLFYLPSGNPFTLESLVYGGVAAVMLIATLTWFGGMSRVLTSDKFIYLFGRFAPALSLVLSMTLRFVPRFRDQYRAVIEAQACLGKTGKVKSAVNTVSIMLTWSLESAIDTSDSMKSRGYGLAGRSAYSIFRLEERDILVLLWLAFCGIYVLSGILSGGMYFRFFPTLKAGEISVLSISFQTVWFCLCMTPTALSLIQRRAGT